MSNPTLSPRHIAALRWAQDGIPVFPCVVGGKKPATPNGQHDATTNLDQINAWWQEADYNVAFCPASQGWCIVDLDGDLGIDEWDRLAPASHETYTVRTPRGGLHLYYQGNLPSSQHRLAPHIDTRGQGVSGKWTYALIPPSVIEGKEYELAVDIDVAPVPDWLSVLVTTRAQPKATTSATASDTKPAIARAVVYLSSLEPTSEGQGSDALAFTAAATLHDLGISEALCFELMHEHFKCEPLDDEWLDIKVSNAYRYAQNDPGVWSVEPAAKVFGSSPVVEKPKRSRFYFEDECEQDTGVEPAWLFEGLIQEETSVMLYGATQSYKSFIALAFAMAAATGEDALGVKPTRVGPAFYAAAEGRSGLKTSRRRAWRQQHGYEGQADIYVAPAPMLMLPDDCLEFVEQIEARAAGRRPGLIVLDTVAKIMAGMNENDARDAGQLVRFVDMLKDRFHCPVMGIHHEGKDAGRGARGSAAFHAGFDTVIDVSADRGSKAVKVRVLKHKDADERETPWYLEGRGLSGSLVFQPIDAAAYRTLVGGSDLTASKNVGLALAALGARGQGGGVTTYILAGHLLGPSADSREDQMEEINRLSRSLVKLSKDRLAGYVSGNGKDITWFLPD